MGKITISDNGAVSVPANVQMRDFEIARLFGVMIPTIRSNIRAILKSGAVTADAQDGGVIFGNILYPDYYGLNMVVALAFTVDSYRADIFRKWIMRKMMQSNTQPIYIGINEMKDNFLN